MRKYFWCFFLSLKSEGLSINYGPTRPRISAVP
jgi:hypothetical protein